VRLGWAFHLTHLKQIIQMNTLQCEQLQKSAGITSSI